MKHYVYLLRSSIDGNFYTGCTDNFKRRLAAHNMGKVNSTKDRRPLKLLYYEVCGNSKDAWNRERYLKTGMGKRFIRNRIKHQLTNL